MMQILASENANALIELLLEDLPHAVLDEVSNVRGVSEGAIVGAITKQLPSTVNVEQIRNRCIASIRWFSHNGDIATCGKRRYVVVPPYSVLLPEKQGQTHIRICGDPRRDSKIDNALQPHARLRTELVPWYREESPDKSAPTIGLRRFIEIPKSSETVITTALETLDISQINPDTIARNLPSIRDLVSPPRAVFRATVPNWGKWYYYNPLAHSNNRWIETDRWSSLNSGIVRWLPTLDWRGEQMSRYFLHRETVGLDELNHSFACLWMYFYDSKVGNPRAIRIQDQMIYLPYEIPDAHKHWLQLISDEWSRNGDFRRYHLLSDAAATVSRLQETLGFTDDSLAFSE